VSGTKVVSQHNCAISSTEWAVQLYTSLIFLL
jgi:hypothetical protein